MQQWLYNNRGWRLPVRFDFYEVPGGNEHILKEVRMVYDNAGNRVLKMEKDYIPGVGYAGGEMVYETDNLITDEFTLKYTNISSVGHLNAETNKPYW